MLKNLLKDIASRAPLVREQVGKSSSAPGIHQQWVDELIDRMFQLMHNIEQDNFDADRYRSEPPNAFFVDRHAAYFKLLLKHADHFYATRLLLADETSRTLYDQLILFRILGHLHVRLPFNTPENRAQTGIADSWRVEESDDGGVLGKLAIFVTPGGEHAIRVKCWKENIAGTFLLHQYYFNRGDVTIAPIPGDHVIDAGGCFGDTALAFAASITESGRVYTFDPIPKHCAIMRENLAMNPALAPRISVHELGLAATERLGQGISGAENTINPGATAFDATISTTTIDKLVEDGTVSRVDFIKMDIEGSELDALRGAEQTIREYCPRLAISLYHRPEDFIAIPLWIDQLGCGYKFHLEHYSIHHEETVLYAIA
jgi:FkbM family methyltransferase